MQEPDRIDDNAGFLRSFVCSLFDGVRLALTLTGVPRSGAGPWCLLAVAALTVCILALADYALVPEPRQLSLWSLVLDATWVLALVIAVYLIVRCSTPAVAQPLESVLTRAAAALWIPWLVAALMLHYEVDLPHWGGNVFTGWVALILVRATQFSVQLERVRSAAAAVLFFALVAVLLELVPTYPRWVQVPDRGAHAATGSGGVLLDIEGIYYSQAHLLREALDDVARGRPGHRDVYFVGFAGDASEDVFVREVGHFRQLFEETLGAAQRTVLLANHSTVVDELPLANRNNLATALQRIGQLMDPEEDVVFVYMTSHGTRDGRFVADFGPLGVNDLLASDIDRMLIDSGIRWQVVTISACFSGTFLDSLAHPDRLVMTAARADRSSFGCENGRDFTYFGEALKNGLAARAPDYVAAFELARKEVTQRERAEAKEPSFPQASLGEGIAAQLDLSRVVPAEH